MRENVIERRLVEETRRKGGLALKFTSPGNDGVPDRILLFPGGRIAFVELKAPGKGLRPLQRRWKVRLEGLGFRHHVVDGVEMIGGVIDEICST